MLLGIAQRRQRIGRLAGLGDEQRQAALGQGRLAVAELRGDIDLDRQAGEALEPRLAHKPGIIGRATG